ncbi:MAG: hypothetical protein U0525_05820 [Patescibacteria group bacterium]
MEKAKTYISTGKTKLITTADKYPLILFVVLLTVSLVLLFIGNYLRKPVIQKETEVLPKKVNIYRIGDTPKARFQATIEKTGVVTITSLTGGVVSNIYVSEGDTVYRGQNIAYLSSNYQGGNAPAVQRQLAQKQQELAKEQYNVQKDVISKQRDLINKNADNAEELRKITAQSFSDTESVINLNNDVVKLLDSTIADYLNTNGSDVNDSTIRGYLSQKSQLEAANLSLNAQLRANKYTENRDNPPKKIEDIQREISIRQLDLQEKSVEISKSIADLQVSLAYIQEALMYPSSPFSGTVQKVYIKVGQAVSPGTPIALIAQNVEDDPATAIVYVPKNIAEKITLDIPSTVYLAKKPIEVNPSFVTSEAVQGSLFAVYIPIPDEYISEVSDKSVLEVDLSIGHEDSQSTVPFVPLNAVSQTQTGDYVFVTEKNIAKAYPVVLGPVIGELVEIKSGLPNKANIILDQNVTSGEKVEIVNK